MNQTSTRLTTELNNTAGAQVAMHIIVLNSGSNGNAVYVESASSGCGILLDCGISARRVAIRLKIHGRTPQSVAAIFITHEHADHVRGIRAMHRQYRIPVYLTRSTFFNMQKYKPDDDMRFLEKGKPVVIEDIEVYAHAKSHDARDPVFFDVRIGTKRFLYITDLGIHNQELSDMLAETDALLLESNYDEELLRIGSYSEFLKDRIRSDQGHLSNTQAMRLIRAHCDGRLHTLILGHLSANNNTPSHVQRAFDDMLREHPVSHARMHIASRHNVSEVLSV